MDTNILDLCDDHHASAMGEEEGIAMGRIMGLQEGRRIGLSNGWDLGLEVRKDSLPIVALYVYRSTVVILE